MPDAQGRRYSGSGRSCVVWHSTHTHVRITTFVRSSRRSVHGMNAAFPQRGHRSGFAPAGSLDGNHGTLAGMAPIVSSRGTRAVTARSSNTEAAMRPRRCVAILLVLAVLGPVGVASAAGETSGSTPEQVAYGAGSALGTVVYAPVKASFCILG